MSRSYFIQALHLLIFGSDFITDCIIAYITITLQFDKESPGTFYLFINSLLIMVFETFLLEGLFLFMIIQFQKPGEDSVKASYNAEYLELNHQSTTDQIAEIAFGGRESSTYNFRSTVKTSSGTDSSRHISNQLDSIFESNLLDPAITRTISASNDQKIQQEKLEASKNRDRESNPNINQQKYGQGTLSSSDEETVDDEYLF